MSIEGIHDGKTEPQPGRCNVTPNEINTQKGWENITEEMFYGMTIDGGYSNRCCPFYWRKGKRC